MDMVHSTTIPWYFHDKYPGITCIIHIYLPHHPTTEIGNSYTGIQRQFKISLVDVKNTFQSNKRIPTWSNYNIVGMDPHPIINLNILPKNKFTSNIIDASLSRNFHISYEKLTKNSSLDTTYNRSFQIRLLPRNINSWIFHCF